VKKSNPIEIPQQATNFVEFIRSSPLMEVDLDLTRDKSAARAISRQRHRQRATDFRVNGGNQAKFSA
jgi:hypothetical protein